MDECECVSPYHALVSLYSSTRFSVAESADFVYGRMLNLKATFESVSSYASFKR